MTPDDIIEFARRVDTLVIEADSVEEMYRKLNTLQAHGRGGWRAVYKRPTCPNGRLACVVMRPSEDHP